MINNHLEMKESHKDEHKRPEAREVKFSKTVYQFESIKKHKIGVWR